MIRAQFDFSRGTRRLRDNDGAESFEMMIGIFAVAVVLMMIIQVFLVFWNNIMATQALNSAAQEVAARGGLDQSALDLFRDRLPGGLLAQCDDQGQDCLQVEGTGADHIGNRITPGAEETTSGQIMTVSFSYTQSVPLFALVGQADSFEVTRSMKVGSQSLQD